MSQLAENDVTDEELIAAIGGINVHPNGNAEDQFGHGLDDYLTDGQVGPQVEQGGGDKLETFNNMEIYKTKNKPNGSELKTDDGGKFILKEVVSQSDNKKHKLWVYTHPMIGTERYYKQEGTDDDRDVYVQFPMPVNVESLKGQGGNSRVKYDKRSKKWTLSANDESFNFNFESGLWVAVENKGAAHRKKPKTKQVKKVLSQNSAILVKRVDLCDAIKGINVPGGDKLMQQAIGIVKKYECFPLLNYLGTCLYKAANQDTWKALARQQIIQCAEDAFSRLKRTLAEAERMKREDKEVAEENEEAINDFIKEAKAVEIAFNAINFAALKTGYAKCAENGTKPGKLAAVLKDVMANLNAAKVACAEFKAREIFKEDEDKGVTLYTISTSKCKWLNDNEEELKRHLNTAIDSAKKQWKKSVARVRRKEGLESRTDNAFTELFQVRCLYTNVEKYGPAGQKTLPKKAEQDEIKSAIETLAAASVSQLDNEGYEDAKRKFTESIKKLNTETENNTIEKVIIDDEMTILKGTPLTGIKRSPLRKRVEEVIRDAGRLLKENENKNRDDFGQGGYDLMTRFVNGMKDALPPTRTRTMAEGEGQGDDGDTTEDEAGDETGPGGNMYEQRAPRRRHSPRKRSRESPSKRRAHSARRDRRMRMRTSPRGRR